MKSLLLTAALTLATSAGFAATHTIKMLNNGKEGIMVFEPAYLKANKGDTIKFVPTDAAHDVASVSIPKGAKSWKGALGKEVTTKVTEEGVYLYECSAHLPMAMIGVIQVGQPVNLEEVKKAGKELLPKFAMNKERLDKYLSQKVRNYKPAFFPYQPPRRFGPKGLLMEFRLQIL